MPPSIKKSFRLFDFYSYDETVYNDEDDKTEKEKEEKEKKVKEIKTFVIQMFGINELGETCSIIVNDFNPFFYISVPDSWDQMNANLFLQDLKKKTSGLVSIELIQKNKLYGFTAGKKDKFVCITFANLASKNRISGLWYSYDKKTNKRKKEIYKYKEQKLELYESSIPPLLRYFHIQNISPSGWVLANVSKMTVPYLKKTTCNYEYVSSKKWIVPQLDKETLVPYKICSFDIEASSSHGDFPVPKKTYKRLASNMVDVFQKQHVETKEIAIKLIEKMVLTAFGMYRFEGIDLVYPKYTPKKEEIQDLIQKLLNTPLSQIKLNEKASKLLTIDTVFQNVQTKFVFNGDDEDIEEDAAEEQEDPIEIIETETSSSSQSTYVSVVPKDYNSIVDVLIKTEFKRDEKIQILNECLTNTFQYFELKGDETTFIGSTFIKYGQPEPYLNHCLVVGTCSPVQGATIQSVVDEEELLREWTRLIQEENPDIVIGYNIFGFDYEFLFQRSLENGCEEEFLKLSRNIGHISGSRDKDGLWSLDNTKIALASGEYDLYYPKMIGRFQIDLLTHFRKEFNLSSYKLDNVSGQFIGDTISKIVDAGDCVHLYCKNTTGLNVNDYIHIELSEFTTDYFMDGKKFLVKDIVETEETTTTMTTKHKVIVIEFIEKDKIDFSLKQVKWGLAKDDVSVQDIFRLTRGSADDRAIVAKYCIQDCNIVHHLMRKIDVLVGFIEMSRICSVPMSYLVLRGQGIKLTSFVAKKCREKNTLMPDLEKTEFDDGYEGAIVLPPKCSMYIDNPVACLDYSSLYPSNMISQNLSHDSKVWTKEYDLQGKLIKESHPKGNPYDNLPNYYYMDVEFDTYKYVRTTPTSQAKKVKCGKKVCRWAQFPDGKRGILPSILEELLKARKTTKKLCEKEKDEFMKNILDKRQLAYKLTANSLYGQCGSRTSTFYEKDIAASTTALGRMMITYAKKMIEQVYGDTHCQTTQGHVLTKAEYVYGDTDSVFFTFQLEDTTTKEKIRGKKALEITIELAQEVAKLCSSFLIAPMELCYEKTLMPFILLSKKRYVGMLYETNPNKGKLKFMGLSLKRRDACDYLKDVYGGALNILMRKGDHTIEKSIEFLECSLKNLVEGRVPMEKLEISKSLKSDYKNPERIGHKILADRIGERDPGNKPKSGERIKYVFIHNPVSKALVGDRIETPEFIVSNHLKIDYKYYITNQLMKPLQQLFGLAVEDIWKFKGKPLAISAFKREMTALKKECGDDLELFMKKKEKKTSLIVKTLLFDSVITSIYNKENNNKTIDSFLIRK